MGFDIRETYDLIEVVENIKPEAQYLVDRIFPNKEQHTSSAVPVEYTVEQRRLAPYVVKGSRGLNVSRAGSEIALYRTPMMGVKRVISMDDIEHRIVGESLIYSTKTPAERAAEIQARDLSSLKRMLRNRRAQQAAELLQSGVVTVEGYADDGRGVQIDEVQFRTSPIKNVTWSSADADILGAIEEASEEIQDSTGQIPTLMICGREVVRRIQKNKAIKEWLLSGNQNATAWLNFTPQYVSPQVRFLGYISALNLEMVSYTETYIADDGTVKPFIAPDVAIIVNPGRGRQIYGTVSYVQQGGDWQTAAAEEVPVYTWDTTSQITTLALYSRCLLVPQDANDWRTFKVS